MPHCFANGMITPIVLRVGEARIQFVAIESSFGIHKHFLQLITIIRAAGMLLSADDLLNRNFYVIIRLPGNGVRATGYEDIGLRPISLDCSGLDRSDLDDCIHFSGVRTDHHARAVALDAHHQLDGDAVRDAIAPHDDDLMREYARQLGIRRWIIPVPFLTARLSSLWLGLVTPVYARVGRKLIDSLPHETVVRSASAVRAFAIKPRGYREAIARVAPDRVLEMTAFARVSSPGPNVTNDVRPQSLHNQSASCPYLSACQSLVGHPPPGLIIANERF